MRLASSICRGQRSQRQNRLHRPGEGAYEGTAGVLCLRAQYPVTVAGSQGFRGCSCRFLPAFWPLARSADLPGFVSTSPQRRSGNWQVIERVGGRRAAEQRDELAAPHPITSSARAIGASLSRERRLATRAAATMLIFLYLGSAVTSGPIQSGTVNLCSAFVIFF